LKLRFGSATRACRELAGGPVFVATTDELVAGRSVTIMVEVPGSAAVEVSGAIESVQKLSGTKPAGVLFAASQPALRRLRKLLGVAGDEDSQETLKCDLTARVVSPLQIEDCRVKSMSTSAIAMVTPQALPEDAAVKLEVRMSDGSELKLGGAVSWHRPELRLAGIRLTDRPADFAARLDAELKPTRRQKTLLIADDAPEIVNMLSQQARLFGYDVMAALRGDEALELIRSRRPDGCLIDVNMPGLDGVALMKAVRTDPTLRRTAVAVMTAMSEEKLAALARDVGAQEFLEKPIRLEKLRLMLVRLLGQGSPRKP
jgi:two-component system, chemotaxis family, chemotaxis protein CheY